MNPLFGKMQQASGDSYTISNIRGEMIKMQQQLQRCNNLFQEYLTDIPPKLPETLAQIEKSFDSLQSQLKKNRLQRFQQKHAELSAEIGKLTSQFATHKEMTNQAASDNNFTGAVTNLQYKAMKANQELLNELEASILKKLDLKDAEAQEQEDVKSATLKFTSPFSEPTPDEQVQPDVARVKEETTSTIQHLESHEKRLTKLEHNLDVALEQQSLKKLTKEEGDALERETLDNHDRLVKLKVRANLFANKFFKRQLQRYEKPEKVVMRNKRPVTTEEFDSFTEAMDDKYSAALQQIQSFREQSKRRIATITSRIDATEQRIIEFEERIGKLNEAMEQLNETVDEVDAKDEAERIATMSVPVTKSRLQEIVDTYRHEVVEMQRAIRKDVALLRDELDDMNDVFLDRM